MQATFDFELTEEVFVKAKVEPVDAVNLWLGANVMLEYTLEDALHLLVSNPAVHLPCYISRLIIASAT